MRTLLQLAFILSLSSTALAQWANVPPPDIPRTPDGKPDLSAPAPRLPDGKPDLSGIWNPPTGYLRNLAQDLKEEVPFQPWAKTLYDERAEGKYWREEPDANCLPQGVPKVLLAPAPWQIIQTPKVVFFVHEAFNLWWQAFMDGRQFVPHPDVAPTWHGYSTAKWEGDTLVVDSGWLQRQGVAGSVGQALDGSASRDDEIPQERFRTHGHRHHHRRSEGLHEAVGDHRRGHAAAEHAAHGIHLPREREEDRREMST